MEQIIPENQILRVITLDTHDVPMDDKVFAHTCKIIGWHVSSVIGSDADGKKERLTVKPIVPFMQVGNDYDRYKIIGYVTPEGHYVTDYGCFEALEELHAVLTELL